jgi:methionyl-tRNA formyltransferase
MRVVLLCGPSPTSWIMYQGLKDHVEVVRVVVEAPVPARDLLRRRLRRLGPVTVAGQVLFMALNALLKRRSRGRADRILREAGLPAAPPPEALVTRVASVNDPATADLLRALRPDAVVVNGTRIIGRATLGAVAAPFLNTHVGITPRYRGVHGGYWALAEGDPAHCGVTVHLVDEGIDTGGVLHQATIEPGPEDDFNTYPILQVVRAVPLMRAALQEAARGALAPHAGEPPSGLWSHPTLWRYAWTWLRRGVR